MVYQTQTTRQFGFTAQPFTPVVRALLIANLTMFVVRVLVQGAWPGVVDLWFGLSAAGLRSGRIWQPFSYLFLHANLMHVLFNMLVLYFLGSEVERVLGSRYFIAIYLVAGVLGGLGWLLLSPGGLCIGASGAVFGLLGAYVALFPQRYITVLIFFVLPVTLRAWVLALVFAGMEFLMMMSQPGSGVAHSAHLAGLLAGYLFAYGLFRKGLRIHWSRPRSKARLQVLRREDAYQASQQEIDRILDKIAHEGMRSLTRQEREALEKASADRRTSG